MNRLIFAAIVLAVVYGLSGCSGAEQHTPAAIELPPVKVSTATISASNTESVFSVSGNIQPEKEANISTRMMGYIEQFNVEVGQRVRKGQVLVKVSNTDLEAKLAQVKANIVQAEAGVVNAKKDFDRLTQLFEKKSITEKELDDMTAHYTMAKAGLEAARQMENEVNAQFQYTRITAPFSGVVTGKYVNAGDMANPGMPLLTLANSSAYQVVAMVPENRIASINKGQSVTVLVKSLDQELKGVVEEIAISSKNTGGQYLVKAKLEPKGTKLYAGMFTTVLFKSTAPAEGAATTTKVLIPETSIISKGGLKGVYTVSADNKALLRWLRIGKQYGDQYEVLSGLSSGETIIVDAQSRLFNGAPVQR